MCFSLNEKDNIEIIKQHCNYVFNQNGNYINMNYPEHITSITKEIFIQKLSQTKSNSDSNNIVEIVEIIKNQFSESYVDVPFLDKIYNSINPNIHNDFISYALQSITEYDRYNYNSNITFSQSLLSLIDKYIATKNIPSRDNLILALNSNSFDVVKSFISAGAKLDQHIFNDLIDFKCKISNPRINNIKNNEVYHKNHITHFNGLINKDIVELLIDNNYVPTKAKLLEYADKIKKVEKNRYVDKINDSLYNVENIVQKVITKKEEITWNEFIEFTKRKILFKNYAKLGLDVHKEEFRKLCGELDIEFYKNDRKYS
jgi:hypothetical protein